ncbi:MAG: uroporphyrinogen-III synthase [Dermabacter sp.]|nr:uroporphyrinogen-III synthase [Dermabacter sp.]
MTTHHTEGTGGTGIEEGAPIAPVLITRPEGRASGLVRELAVLGIPAVHSPFIEFRCESDTDLREAVQDLARGEFQWLLLTSATTVSALTMLAEWAELPAVQEFRAAAVGEKTAQAAREAGLEVSLIAQGSAASLIDVFPPNQQGPDGLPPRILYPVSSAAAPQLELALKVAGYDVQRETAYRPKTVPQPREVVDGLASGAYSAVVATSSMIVRALGQLSVAESTKLVVIGTPSHDAALSVNLPVAAVATSPNDAALAQAVKEALEL